MFIFTAFGQLLVFNECLEASYKAQDTTINYGFLRNKGSLSSCSELPKNKELERETMIGLKRLFTKPFEQQQTHFTHFLVFSETPLQLGTPTNYVISLTYCEYTFFYVIEFQLFKTEFHNI